MIVEVITELGGYDNLVTAGTDRVSEERLALPVAVHVRRVEESDPQVERLAEKVQSDGVILDSPHGGGDGPNAESDDRCRDSSAAYHSVLHEFQVFPTKV